MRQIDSNIDTTSPLFADNTSAYRSDLETLREGRPTLADLCTRHGESWVRFHGLRLCLLGMARLGG